MNKRGQRHKDLEILQGAAHPAILPRDILSMEPEAALDAIFDSPSPAALVQSFSEQDFFLLVQEIGPSDALELLSLASFEQWGYILDIEAWDRDRLALTPLTRWLGLLMTASPARVVEWFLNEEKELIEFYMFRNMTVYVRQHDQDPSDLGEWLFTLDDMFYINFQDDPAFENKEDQALRDTFLTRFLHELAECDYGLYHRTLLEFGTFIPAEFEEEAYRLRNVRLAEKGFLPFDEATSIYQPLKAADLKKGGRKIIVKGQDMDADMPVPVLPAAALGKDSPLTRALQEIQLEESLERLQAEFAGLSNQIIAADARAIRTRAELSEVVKKACGYISIGLEFLTSSEDRQAVNAMAALIQKYPLSRLFQVGYGKALSLKWRAQRWLKSAWFEKKGLPLGFFDEEWMGVVGGLLLERPLYFDNYQTGVVYREFASLAEIQSMRTSLNAVMALDALLNQMDLPVVKNRFFTYKRLLLTLWARHWLDLPETASPIALDQFQMFFSALWAPDGHSRKIQDAVKDHFLGWLADKSGRPAADIAEDLGQVLTDLFDAVEDEYGAVAETDLNPQLIHLFWVQRESQEKFNAHI